MAFIFKKKKSAKQLTEALIDALRNVDALIKQSLEPGQLPPLSSKTTPAQLSAEDNAALEVVAKRLTEVRHMMCGDSDNPPKKEDSLTLAQNLREQGVPLTLIQNMGVLPFEARNDACHILSYMIQSDLGGFASKYMRTRSKQVVRLLVDLFADSGIALHCGSLLRDCLRYEFLAAEFLESSLYVYNRFFDEYLVCESFDISSDAFATFRLSLTKHMALVPQFLDENYEAFFVKYNKLLLSDQYVTQRQSLKLLGEMLLDRQNYNVMIAYIGDKDNLKIIMNLMRVKSAAIQMEAFHVFKVFVANPKKTEPVAQILARNRDKIIAYLHTLNIEQEDDQFVEERNLLIGTLSKMRPKEDPAAPKPVSAAAVPGPKDAVDTNAADGTAASAAAAPDPKDAPPAQAAEESAAAPPPATEAESPAPAPEQPQPAAAEAPSAAEAPAASETPAGAETPAASEAPAATEAPTDEAAEAPKAESAADEATEAPKAEPASSS